MKPFKNKSEAATWCYRNAIWVGGKCSVLVGSRGARYQWSTCFLDLTNYTRLEALDYGAAQYAEKAAA